LADIVIGSGPAGVSAAMALLDRGREVVMIDVGERLEPDQEAFRARMAGLEPADWAADDLAAYKAPQLAQGEGEIRRYGSDFLVRDREGLFAEPPPWLSLRPSFALGGLSNGWGASVLPYRQEDLVGWPVSAADLATHYRAVADFMPIAGAADDLDALFPVMDMTGKTPLAPSAQAEGLMTRLQRRRAALQALNVVGGRARQAIRTDCRRCGLCLHGCPFEYVFKASQVVERMRLRPGFDYRPGLRVVGFKEEGDAVTVTSRRADGSVEDIVGERLFVGAGVLPTAQLALRSLGAPGTELRLSDSQHFFLPLLHLWNAPRDPTTEARHALAQAFLEVTDPAVSPYTVHAQLYTYSEFYALDMRRRYGAKAPFLGPLFDALGRRLIVAQVFLHSDHSHRIGLSLAADGERLAARLIENPELEPAAERARRRFARTARVLGLAAITPASRVAGPASSFHAGSTLPMRASPEGLETDGLGRLSGLSRVHVVDASVLPSIPATTITYTVMANAHRIAARAP
jgi:choline dehydrogenase-like flavoprotein